MEPLGPFGPSPALAAGVSGGPHSLALAFLARDWTRARGGSLLALVADHGLRDGSGAEAAGVATTLVERGIAVRLLPLALAPGPALQERARDARLDALLRAAGGAGTPWLLLGQHRADQAETMLFRLLRGSGEAGLAGMAPARAAADALVLRPLLSLPPFRLEATLAAAGLDPVRDPSNVDSRFARARLRAALADPGGDGPGVAALDAAANAFSRRRAALATAVAARLAEAAVFQPEGWAILDAAALGTDAVAREVLARLVRAVSGGAHPPPRAGVEALLTRRGGTLAGALWRGRVLCREPAAIAPPAPAVPGARWDGRWRVSAASPGAAVGALGEDADRLPRGTLPGAVARGLPALRRGGALLDWAGPGGGAALRFSPAGGAPA